MKTTFERKYGRMPNTPQEVCLSLALSDGWEVVVWDGNTVCLVLRGTPRVRTRYAEIGLEGTLTIVQRRTS
jgi:hypothetical protein